MPVNPTGGKSSSGGPFGFLNAPSERAAKAKVAKPKATPVVRKVAAPKAATPLSFLDKPSGQVAAHEQTPAFRKQTRADYAAKPLAERRRIVRAARGKTDPASVAVLQAHEGRVRAQKAVDAYSRVIDKLGAQASGDEIRSAMNDLPAEQRRLVNAGERVSSHRPLPTIDFPHLQPVKSHKRGAGLTIASLVDGVLSGRSTAGAVSAAEKFSEQHVAGPLTTALIPSAVAVAHFVNPKGTKRIVRNAGRDLVDIPANAIPSLYVPAKAAVEGHPGKAAAMLAQPFIQAAEHPLKSLEQHPVSTPLMFAGLRGAGHGIGKVMRVAPSQAIREAASTERAPATVPGTKLAQHRTYSRDPLVKAVQVAKDRRNTAKGKHPTMTPHEIRRRVDESAAASEDVRRINRAEAVTSARRAVTNTVKPTGSPAKRAKVMRANRASKVKPTAATVLRVQNITDGTPADLSARLAELGRASTQLEGAKLRVNLAAQTEVRTALKTAKAADPKAAAAVARFVDLNRKQQDALVERGILTKQQAEAARLQPYAVRKMGAKVTDGGLVAADGTPLPVEQIRAHMAAHGVPEPAFVTHAPNARGARNFFVPTHEPPRVSSVKRTGAALTEGTADLHPDMLVEGAARAQGLADAADRYARFVKEFAVRGGTGKVRQFQTYEQARRAADEAAVTKAGEDSHAVPLRPVRLTPFVGKHEQLSALLEHANDEQHPAFAAIHDAIENALTGHDGGTSGTWTLVPDAAADQMRAQVRTLGPGPAGKVGRVYGSRFRTTVLATNPRWLTGNVIEAALRSLVAHAGPRSYATGHRALAALDKLDPAAAKEARVRTVGGGHYSMNARLSTHTSAEQFAGTKLAGVATALGKFWRTPGPKQVAAVWHGYTDVVFHALNGKLETQFQTAMLGKALRDSPLMSDHLVKLSTKAIDEAASGLRDTNAQVAFGREVDRMYGRYSKYSPALKTMIAGYTPFIAWSLNAAQFVGSVLPKDHPVATAVIASANQATAEWRREHGLLMGAKGAVPGFLMGAIPIGADGKLRLSRYTPFGAFGSPGETAAGAVLPQFTGALQNLEGRDWKGKTLRDPAGDPVSEQQRWLTAAVTLVEGSVPLVAQAHRIADRPGNAGQRLRAEFDPFKATTGKKPGGSTAGAGSPAQDRIDATIQRITGAPAVSQAEIDAIIQRVSKPPVVPPVSQAELKALLDQSRGGP